MEDTGRIKKALTPTARRILLGQSLDQSGREELWLISQIDQAHLLMLFDCGIINHEAAARLLRAIERLRAQNFAPLEEKRPTRGLYLLYEDYLIESEGAEIGGILQTARSRNDLNATLFKLKLRQPYLRVLHEAVRLHAVLLRRARLYAHVVMPVYTHAQAAMPLTYGYYLAGVATALLRNLDPIICLFGEMQQCPLGAGAVAGTSFPIRTARTAELLGFDSGPSHALHAVACRDLMLHLLASASIYALSLSRFATDMLHWTTAEFNFLSLPDTLVGSSSAMPQKRNAFILEHVQGRSMSLLGAFVQAVSSMHSTSFTNSIAVGTEAVRPLWGALQDLTDITVLMRLMVGGARPVTEAMLRRCVEGFTTATAFADRLVAEHKTDFRTAHRLIGSAVLETLELNKENFPAAAESYVSIHGISASFDDLDPESVVKSLEYGGGPGPGSIQHHLTQLTEKWHSQNRQRKSYKQNWKDAALMLKRSIGQFIDTK